MAPSLNTRTKNTVRQLSLPCVFILSHPSCSVSDLFLLKLLEFLRCDVPVSSTLAWLRPKSCPLCKQSGRDDQHFLSSCPYLPPEDHTYLSRSCFMSTLGNEDPDYMDYAPPPFTAEDEHPSCTSARSVSHGVSTKQSPHFKAYLPNTAHP